MILDMESNLKNDTSGTYKKELIAKFTAFSTEVKQELSKGLTPKKFEKLDRLLQAIDAGVNIIKRYEKPDSKKT